MHDNTEFDIQQKMVNLFEKIIDTQLENIVENKQPVGGEISQDIPRVVLMRQSLKRDFRDIFISRDEYLRVCQKGGAFSLLYDSGSGSYTNWFLYNSEKRNRLFMVWVHQSSPGVLEFHTDGNYLGVLEEQQGSVYEETNTLYELCFQQYLNNINKIIGGFRDDVSRITQL